MTVARTSRESVQVLFQADPNARISRESVEILFEPSAPKARTSRVSAQVLFYEINLLGGTINAVAEISASIFTFGQGEFDGFSQGTSTVTGTLDVVKKNSAVGRGYIANAYLDNGFNELQGIPRGEAIVVGDLFTSTLFPYKPVNYPLGHGFANVADLYATTLGYAEVFGQPDLIEDASSTGTSTVQGTLTARDGLDGESIGSSLVQGEIFIDNTVELAGVSIGEGVVRLIGNITGGTAEFINASFFYYIYGNVTAGFDPTDLVGGADGSIIDFPRHVYLYLNNNVGFDYTDDSSALSTFISQSYPDGDIIRDFARHMYQYLLVIKEITPPEHRLTIGPAPRGHKDLTPAPRPPRQSGKR